MWGEDDISQYIERRLQEWARWYQWREDGGVGYPPRSSIVLFQVGISIVKQKPFTFPPLPTNESAEEIEKIVAEMSKQNKNMGKILKKFYLGKELTLLQKARVLGMSEAMFKIYLSMARQWIAGRLSINFKYN